MATKPSTDSDISAKDLVSKYETVCDIKMQNLLADTVLRHIYTQIERTEKAFNDEKRFPKDEWQNAANLALPTPKTVSTLKKVVPKIKRDAEKKIVKGADGKPIKIEGETEEKDRRLKKITTFNTGGKAMLGFLLASMAHETKLALDELQKKKAVSPSDIKGLIVEVALEQCEGPVSPLIFSICEKFSDLIVTQNFPVTHNTVDLTLQSKLVPLFGVQSPAATVAAEFTKFIKLFAIYLANGLWHECKEDKPESKTPKAADAKDPKEGKAKKKKAAPKKDEDEETDLVGVSKTTSAKHVNQFLHQMHDMLLSADEHVNLSELIDRSVLFERAFNASETIRKEAKKKAQAENKAKKETEGKVAPAKGAMDVVPPVPEPVAETKVAAPVAAPKAAAAATPAPAPAPAPATAVATPVADGVKPADAPAAPGKRRRGANPLTGK